MHYKAVEVHTPEGSFFVSCFYGRFSCEAKLAEGVRSFGYPQEIPEASRSLVRAAAEQLVHRDPRVFPLDPWKSRTLRIANLNTCNDCSGQTK